MTLKLNTKFVDGFINENEFTAISPVIKEVNDRLRSKTGLGAYFLGWIEHPQTFDKEEFERIKAASEQIKKSCDVFIVIGIGGSYLGSRAVIEFLKSPLYNSLPRENTPEIYFSGNSISTTSLNELLTLCEGKDVCINVISKSGTTTEPAIAFRVFRELLIKKYGEEGAKSRIFVTTDRQKGALKSFSTTEGYQTFVVPDDIGGRFSVLSAVGLLPIAVSGISIDELMSGADDARIEYNNPNVAENNCYKYAALRNMLYSKGKTTEILVGYEPFELMLCEWWKQLFGESEGKDNKGIFPASVIFSTDLHSLGQYVQDGLRNIFETVISIEDTGSKLLVPHDENNIDGLNFLSGKEFDNINKLAMLGTLLAHNDGGVPNIVIELKDRTARSLGHLIYFFELACAISGYILGVNPFDQPGVEAYKKNMFALLGKPGYEKEKEMLLNRVSGK